MLMQLASYPVFKAVCALVRAPSKSHRKIKTCQTAESGTLASK